MLKLASLVEVTTRIMNQTSWQVGAMNAGLRSRAIATWRFCTEPTVHLPQTPTHHRPVCDQRPSIFSCFNYRLLMIIVYTACTLTEVKFLIYFD